ncbi:uncharacterized protein [Phaseolus vulgaris]|uniref:uncharacterized protein n=1 Tax=Phaseolus vulgaris TaxID=3885 RepID=UPI0035CA24F7
MTSDKERRQRLLALARSRQAAGAPTEVEATAEPLRASPISVAPAEGRETRGDKKRRRLVKAPTTVITVEEESSGSPLVQRKRKGTEGPEGDASPLPQAHASPERPPSPAPLSSPPPAKSPPPTQAAGSGIVRSEETPHPLPSPRPQDSATTTEGGGESSFRVTGPSAEGLPKVLRLTKQLLQNQELIKWSSSELDLHLARQMVLSLEFSTRHRRLEKLEGRVKELLGQQESLQSDYEALQDTNSMLKKMLEETQMARVQQIQETIKTEMLMGDAVATLDSQLMETTGKAVQLKAETTYMRQQNANLTEALATSDQKQDAESTIATLTTEKAVLEADKAGFESEKAKLWEEAADTFTEGFDFAIEQLKCAFPEVDRSQLSINFEVVDGKIVRP